MTGARVAEYSQPHVLRAALAAAGTTHGAEVRANVLRVRVDPAGGVYFCDVPRVPVTQVTRMGDGLPLPKDVTLAGELIFPFEGYWDINDIRVVTNGTIQLVADKRTRITPNNTVLPRHVRLFA